jgi:hypothetical protein
VPADRQTLEFLAWLAARPRGYGEMMQEWAANPAVWEAARRAGLARMNGNRIDITAAGRAELQRASGH